MEFLTLAERLGVPVAVLVFLGVALYKVLKWLGKEVFRPITESHIALVRSIEQTNMLNAKTLEKVGVAINSEGVLLTKIQQQNDSILDLAAKNKDLLEGLKNQIDSEKPGA
jgi:hypothetical protein